MNQAILSHCEAMIRRGSDTFYNAFRLLPSPRREAVYVIYAFCRMIDDSIDEPERSPYTIEQLEEHFFRLSDATGHFIWPALRWLFREFPVSPEPFLGQMRGQRRDLVLTHYETMDQLEDYCYLVAGTVGEMLLPVLHERPDHQVVQSGIALGKAMQIINIVRDIGEDQGRSRRYLPRELLVRHGYSETEFASGVINPSFVALIEDLCQTADRWFAQGMENLETYPKQSAFSVELAGNYYRAILDEVRRNGYQVFTRRAVVSNWTKTQIYLAAMKRYDLSNILHLVKERWAVS